MEGPDFDANPLGMVYHTKRSKTLAQGTTERQDWSVHTGRKKSECLELGLWQFYKPEEGPFGVTGKLICGAPSRAACKPASCTKGQARAPSALGSEASTLICLHLGDSPRVVPTGRCALKSGLRPLAPLPPAL